MSEPDLINYLNYINKKITEKFDRLNAAYRFFSGYKMDKISFSDFAIALEKLKVKLTTKELSEIFNYLDKNRDGFIDYREFCMLSEEKYKKIDPFDND